MSTFTLAISCLTTSNLPWFMDLTFQVPMQYCSLQLQTLLPSLVISTTGFCFCFGSVSSFFLELFLHWSLVTYWAPTNLGSSSFSVISFCLFIVFRGFSRQESWSGLPFPSPVDQILSVFSHSVVSDWLFAALWTVACQAPSSMGFCEQVYWSGLPFPSPGDLPDPGIKPASLVSPALQADSLPLSHHLPYIFL